MVVTWLLIIIAIGIMAPYVCRLYERYSLMSYYDWLETHGGSIRKLRDLPGPLQDSPELTILVVTFNDLTHNGDQNYVIHRSFNTLPRRLQRAVVRRRILNTTPTNYYVDLKFYTAG